ncbi:MAG: cyclic nucleotide-binding domain-containing protein, partial [Actinobacteria bacterium]|nr:cyclic nucleotide-binding domain-containing protein [Actinomycetota bacterium]
MTEHVERLREIPLFAELDEGALERVAAIAAEAEFPAQAVMIERGQPGLGVFVILEGSARAHLRGRDEDFGPGDFVGELSLLVEDSARAARVLAVTPVRCLA